jgi:hypothetical protein
MLVDIGEAYFLVKFWRQVSTVVELNQIVGSAHGQEFPPPQTSVTYRNNKIISAHFM